MSLAPNRTKTFFPTTAFIAAKTVIADVMSVPPTAQALTVQAVFAGTVTSGTSVKSYVQTSFDEGTTWVDVMCFAFANTAARVINSVRVNTAVGANYTATDGSLTDNTIKDGLLGDRVRVKTVSVGTYDATGATLLLRGVYDESGAD